MNELLPQLMGVGALNAYIRSISASRIAMYCSHIGQSLVVAGATVNRTVTGVEREYAKDDHCVRFPCDAEVIRVIHKYPRSLLHEAVRDNTVTAVIFHNLEKENREVDVLFIENYHSLHKDFGFNYVFTDNYYRLKEHERYRKGDVLANSPIVTRNGDYAFGIEAQVAMMSIPNIIEDGVVISDEFANKLKTKGYGTRTINWGANNIPLNLYGDPKNPSEYKAFPNVGEYVNHTGVLFATRTIDDINAVPLMSRKSLSSIDFFDKPVHAIPGAKVIDVIVYKGNRPRTSMPKAMEEQLRYYHNKTFNFYKTLNEEHYKLKRKYGENLVLSPRLSNTLVKAEVYNKLDSSPYVTPRYQKRPLEEWMVEIVFEYDIIPTVGFKLTGMHGDKGVICDVWPKADMPTDCTGNVADVVTDFDSTTKRMNPGRTYEAYISSSSRVTANNVAQMLKDKQPMEEIWDYLLNFYSIVSPLMLPYLERLETDLKVQHLMDVATDGIYRFQPTNNPVDYPTVIDQLRKQYPAPYGPVRYRNAKGKIVTTKSNVLIGGMYLLLLEKIGNTWQAVASPKLQHYGIPAKLSNADKYAAPGRLNPVRIFGESEVRLISAICGGDITADILDQSNNPIVHREITNTILTADQPTNIGKIIDRNKFPVGNGRILTMVRHILECAGIKIVRGSGS